MEVNELISKSQEFIENFYQKNLFDNLSAGKKFLVVDFKEISQFNLEMAEEMLDKPEETIKAMEVSLKNFDLGEDAGAFAIRVKNLPEEHHIFIRNIRSTHLNRFIWTEGVVRQKSDVRPQVTSARFECPSCGNIIPVLQLDKKFKEPSRCGCGRKGKFRLISKELVDAQGLVLEEASKDLEGGEQPKRMNVFLKNDLVSPMSEKKTNPGNTIKITGIIKEVPIILKTGGQSTKFDLLIEANYIEGVEENYSDIIISPEDAEQIKVLSQDPKIYEKLRRSLAPGIFGHDMVKEALCLQMVGGASKMRDDGVRNRGDIHILLIGDPGSGKSQLLKRASVVAPKARYVSGKGVSGAGLCIAPQSMLMTNPGGIEVIKEVVDKRLTDPERVSDFAWKQEDVNDVKIQGMSHELKLNSQHPEAIWKLNSPDTMYKIILSSGKSVELTPNTQLFTLENGKAVWKKSSYLKIGEYIATPRHLIGGDIEHASTVDFIESNPVVHNIKSFVKEVVSILTKKYGGIRNAARILGLNENLLYHSWVNEKARGNIKLNSLKKMCVDVGIEWKKKIKEISLYNGKNHFIPEEISPSLLYFAGLIAGDGDIRKSGDTYSVRFSNSEKELHNLVRAVLENEFRLKYDVQQGNKERPEATRAHSKILAEILLGLGVIESPKSHRLFFSDKLLHFSNRMLANFIAGIYDTDGSICIRKTKGSNVISYTTCSKVFAKQLQIVLLRYGIHAKLRVRKPSMGKIKGKHEKYELEIRGVHQIKTFATNFELKHPEKSRKLKILAECNAKGNTNIDLIPGIAARLRKVLVTNGLQLTVDSIRIRDNMARDALVKIVNSKSLQDLNDEEFTDIKRLVNSDIFWEKIVSIEKKTPDYEYVYDLTVKDTHNFVVDGVLVHNTAAVVKDEFLSGWSLEAGALVLANKGMVMIDELDKMSDDDRSAMHEALEQQSYHHDFEIMLKDGSARKIGRLIDGYFERYPDRKIKGKNCEIMPVDDLKILTTDFNRTFATKADRISRHSAPDQNEYVKISYENGRSVTVTPEHPIFVYKDGRIREISACLVKKYMFAPAARILNTTPQSIALKPVKLTHFNNKKIKFPKYINSSLAKLLGYIVTEGHSYYNQKTRYAEIGVSNTDKEIINDASNLFKNCFSVMPNINLQKKESRKKATKDLLTARCVSIPLYHFFRENFYALTLKAPQKRIPNAMKASTNLNKAAFLHAAFKGDGFVDSERCGYSTASEKLACDYQDMLLEFGIWSYTAKETREGTNYYKVVLSGQKSLEIFLNKIVKDDQRKEKIMFFTDRSKNRRNARDVVPFDIVCEVNSILKQLRLSDGYFATLIARHQNSHKLVVKEQLDRAMKKIMSLKKSKDVRIVENAAALEKRAAQIIKFLNSDIKLIKIKRVEFIKDKKHKWVYDVTVEPTRTFISSGLVLHNTVSISKANIQATLRCETTVLAAANPKFGRFDPYETVGKQIDLPPALINRFDLIFTIKDIPDVEKDKKMARFILELHKISGTEEVDISTDMLRKYLVYARQKVNPKLTDNAIEEIEEYYLKMRSSNSEERGLKTIPISPRQLEALVRLSEASAKLRLSDKVSKKDARRAIALQHYCLEQVGMDPETGKIDIDRISTGITTSERSKIIIVRETINELEEKFGKSIPIGDIITIAKEKGVDENITSEIIEKMKRSGDLFEPKRGEIQRI